MCRDSGTEPGRENTSTASRRLYTRSRERYEPCLLRSGEAFGTPESEEGFDVGAALPERQLRATQICDDRARDARPSRDRASRRGRSDGRPDLV
jgi:hypothetical protein